MKEIKKLFFTYRNGAVAETLRRYGIPHKVIFGLQVPQLAEIARRLQCGDAEQRMDKAEQLWQDREVRESRLLATYLFAPERVTPEKALALAGDTRTQEEADMLAFRLFKRMPQAEALLAMLEAEPANEALRRCAEALRRHLS